LVFFLSKKKPKWIVKNYDPEPFTRVIHEIAGCWPKKSNGIVILRKLGRGEDIDIVPILEKVTESQKNIIDLWIFM
jgi:hypothetical protein